MDRDRGFVYIIEALGSDRFKIGWTRNVPKRLEQLKTGCPFPIALRWCMEGVFADEARLHSFFQAERLHGEWFGGSALKMFLDLPAWTEADVMRKLKEEVERQEDAGHDTQSPWCALYNLNVRSADSVEFDHYPSRMDLIRTAAQCLRMAIHYDATYYPSASLLEIMKDEPVGVFDGSLDDLLARVRSFTDCP